MKKFLRVLAMVLILALFVTTVPFTHVSAATNFTEEYTVLEVTKNCNIKAESYAGTKTLFSAVPGDLLYAVDDVVNKYGNLWYRIIIADEENGGTTYAFVYSGDAQLHQCKFNSHNVDDATEIEWCRCGKLNIKAEGVRQQESVALGQQPGLLTPEEVEALLGILATAKGIINAAKGLAEGVTRGLMNPFFIIPLTVTGITVLVVAKCDGKAVSLEEVKNYKQFKDMDFDQGMYYKALVYTKSKKVLFLQESEMEIDEAATYMTVVAAATSAYTLIEPENKESLLFGNVYTQIQNDAKKLCQKLYQTGLFTYGGDRGAYSSPGTDSWKLPGATYYEHYHLQFAAGFLNNNRFSGRYNKGDKVPGTHIFFGNGVVGVPNIQAA